MSKVEKTVGAVGCVLVGVYVLLAVAFWGAVVWGIVELVSWLVTK
ncbi:hypothetical protein [Amycolatopsis orientalis]|nr:hypothetical protein [Amycolatopsis orientalis]